MIKDILRKAEKEKKLTDEELLTLLSINNDEDLNMLCNIAVNVRNNNSKLIKLTSTVHLTNKCQVEPRCHYCGFAVKTSKDGYYDAFYKSDEEIYKAVKSIEEAKIPRVSCSGGHGYKGKQAVNAAKIVKNQTNLEILVNVGADLTEKSINQLAELNADTVCCNLETINEEVFNKVKPGETLEDRINVCEMVSDAGIELSSGLLLGIGENEEDHLEHLKFLDSFKTLGEIPIMGFNPYVGTPMENHPPCSLEEQLKIVAVTRLMYPTIRITVPTPTIGPENVRYSLNAGASNLATVIADNYPLEVKGVGSPNYGNLNEVISVIKSLGLTPEYLN